MMLWSLLACRLNCCKLWVWYFSLESSIKLENMTSSSSTIKYRFIVLVFGVAFLMWSCLYQIGPRSRKDNQVEVDTLEPNEYWIRGGVHLWYLIQASWWIWGVTGIRVLDKCRRRVGGWASTSLKIARPCCTVVETVFHRHDHSPDRLLTYYLHTIANNRYRTLSLFCKQELHISSTLYILHCRKESYSIPSLHHIQHGLKPYVFPSSIHYNYRAVVLVQ